MAALSSAALPDPLTVRRFDAARSAATAGRTGGSVSVRGYDRTRDGRREHVGPHTRSATDRQEDDDASAEIVLINARRRGPFDDPYGRPVPLEGGAGAVNRGGGAAIDVTIPNFELIKKLHY